MPPVAGAEAVVQSWTVSADTYPAGQASDEAPVISDNCGGPWSALFVSGLPPGDFPVGQTTTLYSGSVGGQVLTCEFTVTVEDAVPPSVYCPLYDSLQLFLNADCELVWPNLLDSITVDDCNYQYPLYAPY